MSSWAAVLRGDSAALVCVQGRSSAPPVREVTAAATELRRPSVVARFERSRVGGPRITRFGGGRQPQALEGSRHRRWRRRVIWPFVREDDQVPEPTSVDREVLPIPDRAYDGPVFEDAKDPAAKFPPIEPLRPPAGAPNVLIVLIDDAGFGCSSAFGGPCQTPTAERLAGEGLKFSALPHDGAVLADARGAALGPQPPHGRDGRDHGDRDLGAGLQLDPPEHVRAAGGDAQAQRLRDGAVRQVPRGAGVGDEPARPVRLVAERRRRLRVLLRLHRRRDQPVLPGAVRGDDAGRARQDARRRATTSPRT